MPNRHAVRTDQHYERELEKKERALEERIEALLEALGVNVVEETIEQTDEHIRVQQDLEGQRNESPGTGD